MQTFLPYADFRRSAAALDLRRLGKQRVEAYQLLRVLRGETRGWRSHPAAAMWRGHEAALGAYMNACIDEWIRRGYRNTMQKARVSRYRSPPWLGDEAIHASHRANLLRKDASFYGALGWREDPAAPYVWPVGPSGAATRASGRANVTGGADGSRRPARAARVPASPEARRASRGGPRPAPRT